MLNPAIAANHAGPAALQLQMRHRPIDALDYAPYEQLERAYQHLFLGEGIQRLPEEVPVWFDHATDVQMDEHATIIATHEQHALATGGLGPCIAICARGLSNSGETVLSLTHFSGVTEEPEDAMANVAVAMREAGVAHPQFHLIGGMVLPREIEGGSFDTEQRLLSLSNQYDIRGVHLHPSIGEQDLNTGEDNSIDVVMTANQIYCRRTQMHEYEPAA